ncbi:hypothetical protein SDRG_09426 [Saprolegnia diclina VS20]|uniref:Uncharacterized protein n=1 Tax=Saprolegnia diclina (strain VS20) TaxID=1156394 RepID=T0QGY3_SAPDV|nr:hypothetical protein SDRG_09426 [Saprolegnia diclina VS20]EQC32895.1 hypothetical protein SDRG_09426 [Saprolegnia diclina VS20]|eukprot:XP_008613581.1 hypothetical protein SDRG_09426 [Saprolegnia diclina VS20]
MSQLNQAMAALAVEIPATDAHGATLSPKLLYKDQLEILHRMLSLETPTLTVKMLQYLTHDEVCAAFISFITRVVPEVDENQTTFLRNGPRKLRAHHRDHMEARDVDNVTDELLKSYHVTMMLTDDENSEPIMNFLQNKTPLIVRCLFGLFQTNSRGNFHHGCRLLDRLLRYHLDDVYKTIAADGVERYINAMLLHLEEAPVADVFLAMICKPHNAAFLRMYKGSPDAKWRFFRGLSDMNILVTLGEHICKPEYSEAHAVAAADVFLELIDRLAADDNGELLLQPLGHSTQLLNDLIKTFLHVLNTADPLSYLAVPSGRRQAALRCLLGLLHKSSLEQVPGPPTSPYHSFGGTVVNLVPNQLLSLRSRIFAHVGSVGITKYLAYMVETHRAQLKMNPQSTLSVQHTGYSVAYPFTGFRLDLVLMVDELVKNDPSLLEQFTTEAWQALIFWFIQFPHNNLYAGTFARLLLAALRTNDEAILKPLLQKLKFVTTLVKAFESGDAAGRGYVLHCCNLLRLHASGVAPDAYLRSFLMSHAMWHEFEPQLRAITSAMVIKGLGISVPTSMSRYGGYGGYSSLPDPPESVPGIDLGSDYAKSLGFLDDVAWPIELVDSEKKKKKKNKKHKKKTSIGTEDDDEAMTDDDAIAAHSPKSRSRKQSSEPNVTEDNDEDVDGVSENGKKAKKKRKKSKKKDDDAAA